MDKPREITLRFVGEQLMFGRRHEFTVTLGYDWQGRRIATFATNGNEYGLVVVTQAQWDGMVARHRGAQYVAKQLRDPQYVACDQPAA